ncbi:MAG: aspartate 1-decarboxylase [Actinomycetota bacterium]
MRRTMMHGKIHRATVTGAYLDYEGSIALDPDLYEAAGLVPYEQVHVLDVSNGNRFVTYVIEGERGSGEVAVNGAAARLVAVGDTVIVLAYAELEDAEARTLRPKVVLVDDRNRPLTSGGHQAAPLVEEGGLRPPDAPALHAEGPVQGGARGEGEPSPRS